MPEPLKPWTRSTRSRPCPLCGKSGCLVSAANNPEAAICTNTTSSVKIGAVGFLHELRPAPPWTRWRMSLAKLAKDTAR